jgi:integrase
VRNLPAGAAAAALHPVVAGAGFDGLVFHELRHTSAALAIGQGAHPLAIKERLGHSSITVTMDRYGGLFPRLEEAIGEGLDGVLRDSLAASVRPETAQPVRLRRSAG